MAKGTGSPALPEIPLDVFDWSREKIQSLPQAETKVAIQTKVADKWKIGTWLSDDLHKLEGRNVLGCG
jgi:hypothetical protein